MNQKSGNGCESNAKDMRTERSGGRNVGTKGFETEQMEQMGGIERELGLVQLGKRILDLVRCLPS